MKIPRDLSGEGLVMVLGLQWNYRIVHQQGSHIVLETDEPSYQRVVLPTHPALRLGTLNGIMRAIASIKRKRKNDLVKSL